MIFEAFSHPKARDMSVLADDVLLHIPGRMTAVFDGATDAHGRKINGISVGRLAALAAANATAGLPKEANEWSGERILLQLSDAIAREVPVKGEGPASTTAMIAFERQNDLRMVGIGDTGFRVNAGEICLQELMPDRASIPARVALFQHFISAGLNFENSEEKCRHYLGLGLDKALGDGAVSSDMLSNIIARAIDAAQIEGAAEEIERFLRTGLQNQHKYSNSENVLGYGVLNGAVPDFRHLIDELIPRDNLKTLEIFSDGYMRIPKIANVQEWEKSYQQLELDDPFKLTIAPAVKGSTKSSFFDDRTVAILKS